MRQPAASARRQRGRRQAARRRGQQGFTLVELMVALAISSILVMMVLSVFARMSGAYRRQQQVATLQVILAAAQNMLAQDARQAGFQLADGFRIASANTVQRPVRIIDSAVGPDEIRFYSADATVQAKVATINAAQVVVEGNPQFISGELAVIVNTDTDSNMVVGGQARTIALFRSCVVRLTLVGGTNLSLDTALPWGNAGNTQCTEVKNAHDAGKSAGQTMIYRFRASAYRIDPARPALGVLQRSPTGTLIANDWQDLGVGFDDLQVAARMFNAADVTDLDGDGDVQYDWYSGTAMATRTQPNEVDRITRLSLSLSVRTDRTVDGVATAATPAFIDAVRPSHNQLGNHPSVELDPADRIYRYTTIRVDMRNTGATL